MNTTESIGQNYQHYYYNLINLINNISIIKQQLFHAQNNKIRYIYLSLYPSL